MPNIVDRFGALVVHMRSEGVATVEMWLDAAEGNEGGVLVLAAPLKSQPGKSRPFTEAGYRTERFGDLM